MQIQRSQTMAAKAIPIAKSFTIQECLKNMNLSILSLASSSCFSTS